MAFYFTSFLNELFFALFLALFTYYVYYKLILSKHWKNRNIYHLEPVFFLGNLWKSNINVNFWSLMSDWHHQLKEKKLFGLWNFASPVLVVTDLGLIKNILIKDFHYFHDHGPEVNVDKEPLNGHLFNLTGSKWKNMRVKLTPTFTSGKMKLMFPIMAECGQQLQEYMDEKVQKENAIEVKDFLARFTTDIISSCAFGIETNSLKNPDSEFRKYGRKFFEIDWKRILVLIFFNFFPKLFVKLRIQFIPRDVSKFFLNALKETIEYREKNNVQRNDFLQLLIQLKNKGKLNDVDKSSNDVDKEKNGVVDRTEMKFTFSEAAAQAFVFFIAGFETSSTTLTFALYELALNPDVQETLQEELDRVLYSHDDKLTYEAVAEMQYLDWVVHETLRKYPPAPAILRICTEDYKIPDMNVTIEKGTKVFIMAYAIQRDPEYYPNPEKFDPTRFCPEEKLKRENVTALYFGEGPRICIGNRFGLLQVKIGLISLLSCYKVLPSEKTPMPLKYKVGSFVLASDGGMILKFKKRF